MSLGPASKLFLPFLDRYHYIVACDVLRYPEVFVRRELKMALRYAVLVANEVYLSASAYFENTFTRVLLKQHEALCEDGTIRLVGRDGSIRDHFERKRENHYTRASPRALRSAYRSLPSISVPYTSALVNTADAIQLFWRQVVDQGTLAHWIDPEGVRKYDQRLERIWREVPERIGGRAFVLPHVIAVFSKARIPIPSTPRLVSLLDWGYTASHQDGLGARVMTDLHFAAMPLVGVSSGPTVSFREINEFMMRYKLAETIEFATSTQIRDIRTDPDWLTVVEYALGHPPESMHTDKLAAAVAEVRASLINIRTNRRTGPTMTQGDVTVGVITALPKEWLAVTQAIGATELPATEEDPNRYAVARLDRNRSRGSVEVIVTFLPRMGTNSAATASANLVRTYPQVTELVFVGIGCGCPRPTEASKHVRLGDVVVSDRVGIVQIDHRALVDGTDVVRSTMPPPSRRLLNCVRLLETDGLDGSETWRRNLKEVTNDTEFKRPGERTDILLDAEGGLVMHPSDSDRIRGQPRVFAGAIGSSNTLVRDWRFRDRIAQQFDLRALEMEGAGTVEAVWHFGRQYLVVRGISDYGDDRTKNDQWHGYAAAAAASYVAALLHRL